MKNDVMPMAQEAEAPLSPAEVEVNFKFYMVKKRLRSRSVLF